MKKLIKELCKKEGNKSQVKIGDVREVMSKLAEILTNDRDGEMGTEFVHYLGKKGKKIHKREMRVELLITFAFPMKIMNKKARK